MARIVQIADPAAAELRIDLPVADAIALDEGARVDLFLDVDPLEPRRASMSYAAYEAEPTPAGVLAYRVIAAFEVSPDRRRIAMLTAPDEELIHFEGWSRVDVYDAEAKTVIVVTADDIIDAGIFWAQTEGRYHEDFMPILGCPNCNQRTMEYTRD